MHGKLMPEKVRRNQCQVFLTIKQKTTTLTPFLAFSDRDGGKV